MRRCPAMTYLLTLAFGLALGLGVTRIESPRLQAGAGDRSGDSIVATGAVSIQVNPTTKVVFRQDALYFLDYKGGRLMATVPDQIQTGKGTKVLGHFTTRDLIADFRLPPGTTPKFLMTVGEIGVSGFGWAPLYVFETSTKQVAVYQVQLGDSQPQFDLIERKNLP
ncbi:hypothetical protein BH23PLA1_BH23PLA1_23560 [soil metagenome]